jgi:hypothetical protein
LSGTGKYRPVDEDAEKFTIIVPDHVHVGRHLRALAARQDTRVGPVLRAWISKKLHETEPRSDQPHRALTTAS